MFSFRTGDLNTPVFCHSCEISGRIDAIGNFERDCKPPRSEPDLKPTLEVRDCSTEYPQLSLVYAMVGIKPGIIISGMFFKNEA
jgi:hypothetical protein